jgi:hypothetical protein
MKKLLLVAMVILSVTGIQAQSAKFHDGMKKALTLMDSAKTGDDFMSVANSFERIAMAEKNQWLPYYYSALARATATFVYNDVARIDGILDVAQAHAMKADSLAPNNSEIMVLRSMILGGRIMVDPMSRGQMYGMQSMMLLQQAMTVDPGNPRSYYIMGQSLFYTPPQFGGGQEPGCKMFATSLEKYKTFVPASDLHPNWGLDQVTQMMSQCSAPTNPNTGAPNGSGGN